jgi:plastocyanin
MRAPALFTSAAALCVLLALAQPHTSAATKAAGATHTVTIEGMVFVPATLEVQRGDTIVWVNRDLFPHTATARDRSFESREIAAGASWKHVANSPGRFAYICSLHPTMKATLVVE